MDANRNSYKILVEKPEGPILLGSLRKDGRIILKWALKE
jgi:hypothetical protein